LWEKTTGASQQELHYIGSQVTTPTAAAYKRMNQSLMENPNGYLLPLLATGLRFAPSEVGLSLGRQNLDHNSTTFSNSFEAFYLLLGQGSISRSPLALRFAYDKHNYYKLQVASWLAYILHEWKD
jgi:hypothetical protein